MSNRLSRFFRRIFSRGQQPQQTGAPPRDDLFQPPGRSAPTSSSNIPRGPVVTSIEPAESRVIPQMPIENVPRGELEFRPTLRVDRGVQTGPDVPEFDQGIQVAPEMVNQGFQVGPDIVDRGTNTLRPIVPPRSIPIRFGTGGGASPPPPPGGLRPPSFGGGSDWNRDPTSEWFLLFIGLCTSLALYLSIFLV